MAAGRMTDDGRQGRVDARVSRHRLKNVASSETDVLKGSRPTTSRVAEPPIFYVARDYPLGGQGGAEMPNV